MGKPHAGMVCHEGESVPDGDWDVRDAVIGEVKTGPAAVPGACTLTTI